MRRIIIWLLGSLLLCCACDSTPPPSPMLTIVSTLASTIESSPAELRPTPIPRLTSTLRSTESMWLDFVTPISGDVLSSPIHFEGRTNIVPDNRKVIVWLYDPNWNLLSETTTAQQGEIGHTGTFSGEIALSEYTGPALLVAESEDNGTSPAPRLNSTVRQWYASHT